MAVVDYLFHASPWGFVHSFSYELLFFHHLYRLLFFWRRRRNERTESSSHSLSGHVFYSPKRCGSHITLYFMRGLSWSRLDFFRSLGMGAGGISPRIERSDELLYFLPTLVGWVRYQTKQKRHQPVHIRRGFNSPFSLRHPFQPTPTVSFVLGSLFNV